MSGGRHPRIGIPWLVLDIDASAYIAAVEAADGQALEAGVRTAINNYVLALKATTGWAAMDVILPFIGARTLAGALVPLKGNVPILSNFVAGDYDRKLGLKGNGIDKGGTVTRSTSGRIRENVHLSMYCDAAVGSGTHVVSGIDFESGVATQIFTSGGSSILFCAAGGGMPSTPSVSILPEFLGAARNSDLANAELWTSSVSTQSNIGVVGTAGGTLGLFCQHNSITTALNFYSPNRLSSITWGPYYDQPMQVRTAVLNFRTALAAAIP